MPRRIALVAHFDAGDRLRPFVVELLRELRTVCDEVVLGSTARLSESELARAAPHASLAFVRENVGYDFATWRDALERVDLAGVDELVLCNSSVFGPVFPLRRAFERMASVECDAWGMTDNDQHEWHLQSYFVVLRRRVVTSPLVRAFFASVLPYRDKLQIIRSYEIGLSRLLIDHGFTLRALVPQAELPRLALPARVALVDFRAWLRAAARRAGFSIRSVSTTRTHPLHLLRAGMPFVKVELLRDNPYAIPLAPVLAELRRVDWDLRLVEFDRPAAPHGATPELLARASR
jgi:rhamnosyltransferase